MTIRALFAVSLAFCLLAATSLACAAEMSEQSFTVPIGQYFVLDQHGGPAVRMRVSSVDVGFVGMNYVDEFGRGWSVRPEKHNSVSGREANLTLLYRHAGTGFEVYFLNATATPGGQAMIVTRKYQ